MAYSDNPGSIHNQVGQSLMMIRLNVEQEDVAGVSNQVRLLKAMAAPYWDEDWEKEYGAIQSASRRPEDAYEAEMVRLSVLLRLFSEHQIYAYVAPERKDARHLAITD